MNSGLYRVCYYHARKNKRVSRRFTTRKEFDSFLKNLPPHASEVECWQSLKSPSVAVKAVKIDR